MITKAKEHSSDFLTGILAEQKALRALEAARKNNRLPNGYLFIGPSGCGKEFTAQLFAMAANCASRQAEDPRNSDPLLRGFDCECASCRKIRLDRHPDMLWVRPAGSIIKIDQIRELLHALSMKPYEARLRVAVISPAGAMNPEAANAFLKMLEEPPDRTLLILTCAQTSELLPTIVSRCRPVWFNPIPSHRLADMLAEECDIESLRSQTLAAYFMGGLPDALLEGKWDADDWFRRRDWLMDNCREIAVRSDRARIPAGLALALAEKIAGKSGKKETPDADMNLVQTWLRDLLVAPADSERAIHSDRCGETRSAARSLAAEQILDHLRAAAAVRKTLSGSANPRLAVESFFIALAGRPPCPNS